MRRSTTRHIVPALAIGLLIAAAPLVWMQAVAQRHVMFGGQVHFRWVGLTALLALHGIATPGILVGMNGVVAFTGGTTLPVGAAVLALSALPSLRRPRRIRNLVLLQVVLMCGVRVLPRERMPVAAAV